MAGTTPEFGRWASRRAIRHGRLLLAGALGLGGGGLALVLGFFESKPIYARSVADFTRKPERETRVRVQGTLARGSLCKVDGKCEFRFRLADSWQAPPGTGAELEVRFAQCVIPDTFRDAPGFESELSVEGELCEGCSYFEATAVYAKCPGKYELRDGSHEVAATPVRSCSELAQRGTASRRERR